MRASLENGFAAAREPDRVKLDDLLLSRVRAARVKS
jgi:hypothetical protein